MTGCLGFWFWETNKPLSVPIQSTCYTCKNLKELTSVSDASLLDLLAPIPTLKNHIGRRHDFRIPYPSLTGNRNLISGVDVFPGKVCAWYSVVTLRFISSCTWFASLLNIAYNTTLPISQLLNYRVLTTCEFS